MALGRMIKFAIFLIHPIVGIKRKAIFAKPFEKRISGGLFFKSAVNFESKYLIFQRIKSRIKILWCGSSVG